MNGGDNAEDMDRARRTARPSAGEGANEPRRLTHADFVARANGELRQVWEEYRLALPADRESWELGAAYVRESDVASLETKAAADQFSSALGLLTSTRVYVPWENVFFETVTGTELEVRIRFNEMLARAFGGEFRTIGAYLSSRLFRNVEEAAMVKRQAARKGVRMLFLGKPFFGDDRDPNAWAMERQLEIADEYHSRNMGYLIGRAIEYMSRRGQRHVLREPCRMVVLARPQGPDPSRPADALGMVEEHPAQSEDRGVSVPERLHGLQARQGIAAPAQAELGVPEDDGTDSLPPAPAHHARAAPSDRRREREAGQVGEEKGRVPRVHDERRGLRC